MAFNLLDEPFMPCVLADGSTKEFGIRAILANSGSVAEIRDESPLVTMACHRLLLAIIHTSIKGPKSYADWHEIWSLTSLPINKIETYLDKHAKAFDLFDPKKPFLQDVTLACKQPSVATRLSKDKATGNNATLFDHSHEDAPEEVSPAKLARWLLSEQSFAIGGGKSERGYTTHAPLIGGVSLLALGTNLFETLMLNLLIYVKSQPITRLDGDCPIWENNDDDLPEYPRGYLELLTWRSRSIRLRPETSGALLDYAQGRLFKPGTGFLNPAMSYRISDEKGFLPIRLSTDRALWRDSGVLLQWSRHERNSLLRHLAELRRSGWLSNRRPYRLAAIGICNDKARVDLWRHEVLPLDVRYLDDDSLLAGLEHVLNLTEDVGRDLRAAGRKAAWETLRSTNIDPHKDRVSSLYDSLTPERIYWANLETPFLRLLEELPGDDRPASLRGWHATLREAATKAFQKTFGGTTGNARAIRGAAVGEQVLLNRLNKRLRPVGDDNPNQEVPHAR